MANINHDADKASEFKQANVTKSPLLKPNLSSLHNLGYNPQFFCFVRKENKKLTKEKRNQTKTNPFIIHISLRFAEESREVGSERA